MPEEIEVKKAETEVKTGETEKKAETPKPKEEHPDRFDPVKTANVMARQSKEEVMDTLGLLATKKPEWFPESELNPEPKKAVEGNGKSDQIAEINNKLESQLEKLQKDNWTKDAIMEFRLSRDDRAFIHGDTESEIRDSASRLAERLKAKGETELKPADASAETIKPIPNEQPPRYVTRPVTGAQLSVDEAKTELDKARADGTLRDIFGGR